MPVPPQPRWRRVAQNPGESIDRLKVRASIHARHIANSAMKSSLIGSAPVAVSLTSYGHRVSRVHHVIESIGRGTIRPARLVLWLDDPEVLHDLPPELCHQVSRGLEILPSVNYGPHTKLFPYAASIEEHVIPVVTADDDIIYPRYWLKELMRSYYRRPDCVSGFRAHRLQVEAGKIAPYLSWTACTSTEPSFRNVPTGVSGVLYPPRLLGGFRTAGTGFTEVAPTADDLWVHRVAIRNHYPTVQVFENARHFSTIPGSQAGTLFRLNVREGGNDRQISSLYDSSDIEFLSRVE